MAVFGYRSVQRREVFPWSPHQLLLEKQVQRRCVFVYKMTRYLRHCSIWGGEKNIPRSLLNKCPLFGNSSMTESASDGPGQLIKRSVLKGTCMTFCQIATSRSGALSRRNDCRPAHRSESSRRSARHAAKHTASEKSKGSAASVLKQDNELI